MKKTLQMILPMALAVSASAATVTFNINGDTVDSGSVIANTALADGIALASYSITTVEGEAFTFILTAEGGNFEMNTGNTTRLGIAGGINDGVQAFLAPGDERIGYSFSGLSVDIANLTIDSIVSNNGNLQVDATHLSHSVVGGSDRVRTITFSYDVVPEPSSTALLGLGGLALLMRRKR